MTVRLPTRRLARRFVRTLTMLAAAVLALSLPTAIVLGHAELVTSTPADGSTVQAPFAEPILMTFSEALRADSSAELDDSAGKVAATATVSGTTITVTPAAALSDGDFEVRWVSIATDGHILRGTFRFTVAPAASAGPTTSAGASGSDRPTASGAPPTATASGAPVASVAPIPSGGGGSGGGTPSASDVIVPIVAGGLLVVGLAAFVLRRRDSTPGPS